MEALAIDTPPSKLSRPAGNIPLLTLISLISAMGGFLFGYETVVIAGTIGLVKTQFYLSSFMEGWFVSSGLVGCMAGVVLAGSISDRIGRKKVMILSALLLTIASIGCAFAPDAFWLVSFRITGGVGVGIASIVSPLYISEISPPRFRGRFVSLFQLTITIGIVASMLVNANLLTYSLSPTGLPTTTSWHWLMISQVWRGMFLAQAVPSLLFLACAMAVPDSPRWLLMVGKRAAALAVLVRLRANDADAAQEADAITRALADESGAMNQLWQTKLRKALFLGVFLAIFSELSGITVVMYYGPVILEKAGLSASSSLGGHTIIGAVLALCTLLAVWLLDKVGRRRLLLVGIAGAFVSLSLTGLFFYEGITEGYRVVVLLCAFVAFFSFSLGPVKWVVISEIFPTRIRARAMSVATLALWLTDVMINFLFPVVRDRLGISTMFLACSLFLLVQLFVVATRMPETKGMSLEAIDSLWK